MDSGASTPMSFSVLNGLLCRQTQGQTRIADSRLGILDAAGVVEVMELLRQCNGVIC